MKILVVDDDVNTVDVIIHTISWKNLNIDQALFAYGVTKAEEIMREEHPEIVMCDIEMPGQSGIEFLKWIRDQNYSAEFIFLTCHNNFDFATEAITYGAIGYVLKPFNMERMIPVILKAVAKINRDQSLNEYRKYGKYLADNRNNFEQNFWNRLSQEHSREKIQVLIEQGEDLGILMNRYQNYQIVLLSAVVQDDEVEESILYLLKNIGTELITGDVESKSSIEYKMNERNCVLLIVAGQEQQEIYENAQKVIDAAKKYLRRVVNCFIGEEVQIEELTNQREKIEKICLNTPTIKGQIYDKMNWKKSMTADRIDFSQEQYREWIEAGRQLSIICDLRNKFEVMGTKDAEQTFDILYHDFMQVIYAQLAKHEVQVHILLSDDAYVNLHNNANHSAYDFVKWASYVTERTIALIKDSKKAQDVVGQAKMYISEHYKEAITRNDIAEHINLSPDYLARQFKKETGEHINDYLNRYRVSKAKELLQNPNNNASEIAAQVGFGSASYFSTIFKKYTDYTPNEYRKEIKGDAHI